MKVFDSTLMPSKVMGALNYEFAYYDGITDVHIYWDMTQEYNKSTNQYIIVNNWLVAQTDKTEKEVIIKLWW